MESFGRDSLLTLWTFSAGVDWLVSSAGGGSVFVADVDGSSAGFSVAVCDSAAAVTNTVIAPPDDMNAPSLESKVGVSTSGLDDCSARLFGLVPAVDTPREAVLREPAVAFTSFLGQHLCS